MYSSFCTVHYPDQQTHNMYFTVIFYISLALLRLPQWPRGVRRVSAARSPAEIVGSNPAGGYGCLYVMSVVCCQVEVCATG